MKKDFIGRTKTQKNKFVGFDNCINFGLLIQKYIKCS